MVKRCKLVNIPVYWANLIISGHSAFVFISEYYVGQIMLFLSVKVGVYVG